MKFYIINIVLLFCVVVSPFYVSQECLADDKKVSFVQNPNGILAKVASDVSIATQDQNTGVKKSSDSDAGKNHKTSTQQSAKSSSNNNKYGTLSSPFAKCCDWIYDKLSKPDNSKETTAIDALKAMAAGPASLPCLLPLVITLEVEGLLELQEAKSQALDIKSKKSSTEKASSNKKTQEAAAKMKAEEAVAKKKAKIAVAKKKAKIAAAKKKAKIAAAKKKAKIAAARKRAAEAKRYERELRERIDRGNIERLDRMQDWHRERNDHDDRIQDRINERLKGYERS